MDMERAAWRAAVALSVLLAALLVPTRYLRTHFPVAFRGHDWMVYGRMLAYTVGLMVAALTLGALLAIIVRNAGRTARPIGALLLWVAAAGLSPAQSALSQVLALLATIMLLAGGRPGFLSNPAALLIPIFLLALPLAAELALRLQSSGGGWVGTLVQQLMRIVGDRSPVVMGRIMMLAATPVVLITATGRLASGDHPYLYPHEGVLVIAVTALAAWALRILAGQRRRAAQPGPVTRASVASWALVAVVLVLPLLATLGAGDPLELDPASRLREPPRSLPGIFGDWGSDELGRDLRARIGSAWWTATAAGALAATFTAALVLAMGGLRRGSEPASRLLELLELVPPPVLFLFGWGLAASLATAGPGPAAVGLGVVMTLIPQAGLLLKARRPSAPAFSVLVCSGIVLYLGWEVVLGAMGFMPPPGPSLGTILISARMHSHLSAAPWVFARAAAVLVIAVGLPSAAVAAMAATAGLGREDTYIRG